MTRKLIIHNLQLITQQTSVQKRRGHVFQKHILFFILIPSNGTTRIASLIPFQRIAQHARYRSDTEVVRCEWSEYQTATHGKTVQVS